jgi:hypothetical protein
MTALDTNLDTRTHLSATSRRDLGLFSTLAGVMLTLKPSSRGSPPVPDWLRRDVGLPPVDQSRSYWDYR